MLNQDTLKPVWSKAKSLPSRIDKGDIGGAGVLFCVKFDGHNIAVTDGEFCDDLVVRCIELSDAPVANNLFALVVPSPLSCEWTRYALDLYQNGPKADENDSRFITFFADNIQLAKEYADTLFRNVMYRTGSLFKKAERMESPLTADAACAIQATQVSEKPEEQGTAAPKHSGKRIRLQLHTVRPDIHAMAWYFPHAKEDPFVLRRGSVISLTVSDANYAQSIRNKREKHKQNISNAGKTLEHIAFPTLASMASFVYGYIATGTWLDPTGSRFVQKKKADKLDAKDPEEGPKMTVDADDPSEPDDGFLPDEKDVLEANSDNTFLPENEKDIFELRFGDVYAQGYFAAGGIGFVLKGGSRSHPNKRGTANPDAADAYARCVDAIEIIGGVLQKDMLFATPAQARDFIGNGRPMGNVGWKPSDPNWRDIALAGKEYLAKYPEYARRVSAC